MLTMIFIIICLLVLAGLILGIIDAESGEFLIVKGVGIWVVIIFMIIGIIEINTPLIKSLKTPITPELKIETIVINNEIVSSDTTYIYTFSN